MANLDNLVKLVLVFNAADLRVAMVKHIVAGLRAVGDVNSAGNHIRHNRAMEGKGPFGTVITRI